MIIETTRLRLVPLATVVGTLVDFAISLTGFPNNTTLTAAHIHPGVAGVNGGAQIGVPGIAGLVLTNGAGIRATARAVGTGNETVHRIAREMRAALPAAG